MNKTIVSEYVSCGHPDKIADTISDAILDAFIRRDHEVSAGIETMVKDNVVVLGGEVNSTAAIDYDAVVRDVFRELNFPKNHNLAPEQIKIINIIGKQSPEIRRGVEENPEDIGAGDQGFVVGFATNETPEYLGLGHYIAKKICQWITSEDGRRQYYGPDAKSQVVIEEDGNGERRVKSILVSTMSNVYGLDITRFDIKRKIETNEIGLDEGIYNKYIVNADIPITVNPCGEWKIGGPVSDCGVTGRKLVVDQYGGYCNIGGGAYSGKNMTKVDRSAAYMARYIAKNIVASGICDKCKVEISYMIGVPEPSSVYIEMNRNQHLAEKVLEVVKEKFCLKPSCIMYALDSDNPRYKELTVNGHYGYIVRDNEYTIAPWEKTDKKRLFENIYK